MKTIILMMIIAIMAASLGGCFVRTHDHSRHHSHSHARGRRDCPPAYHWDGRGCVHNGRGHARGHRR